MMEEKLNNENYKGYSIKFAKKILGDRQQVEGGYLSRINNKIVTVKEMDKLKTFNKIKAMIDFEISKKRLERFK